jgi:hypothetical protein
MVINSYLWARSSAHQEQKALFILIGGLMREDYNEMLDKLVEELIDEIVNGREVDDDE